MDSTKQYFFLIFPIIGFILTATQIKVWQSIVFHLLNFFILALLCHGQLFLSRPKPQSLTLFYFCLALGGVLAGVFNGVIAPHWFNQVYEYPLAILLSLFALPQRTKKAVGGFLWWYWLFCYFITSSLIFIGQEVLPHFKCVLFWH